MVSLIAPAIIILLIAAILIPGPKITRQSSRTELLKRKFWELEKGWAGLALSCAIAFFITQGLKNLFGKPRPDLLARCDPDLTNIAAHAVGGFGQDISARWVLVSDTICRQTNIARLNDGFRSFPSGHSSFSWSGLLYLSFFLCSKFAIAIPYLPSQQSAHSSSLHQTNEHELLPLHHNRDRESTEESRKHSDTTLGRNNIHHMSIWNQAAAPPNHLIIVAFIPVAVALYISSTRFVEFFHHGFDIIAGSIIGILSAWFAFRWYHLPVRGGSGWAWGARSRGRAFGIGVGVSNYVGDEGWGSAKSARNTGERSMTRD